MFCCYVYMKRCPCIILYQVARRQVTIVISFCISEVKNKEERYRSMPGRIACLQRPSPFSIFLSSLLTVTYSLRELSLRIRRNVSLTANTVVQSLRPLCVQVSTFRCTTVTGRVFKMTPTFVSTRVYRASPTTVFVEPGRPSKRAGLCGRTFAVYGTAIAKPTLDTVSPE